MKMKWGALRGVVGETGRAGKRSVTNQKGEQNWLAILIVNLIGLRKS